MYKPREELWDEFSAAAHRVWRLLPIGARDLLELRVRGFQTSDLCRIAEACRRESWPVTLSVDGDRGSPDDHGLLRAAISRDAPRVIVFGVMWLSKEVIIYVTVDAKVCDLDIRLAEGAVVRERSVTRAMFDEWISFGLRLCELGGAESLELSAMELSEDGGLLVWEHQR